MRLVNTDKAVDIEFDPSVEPKALLKMIGDAGHPGTIGLISLRALLEGTGASEINGYTIIGAAEEDEAVALKAASDAMVAEREAAAASQAAATAATEGDKIEEAADQAAVADQAQAAVEGAAEAVATEVAETSKDSAESVSTEGAADGEAVSTDSAEGTAAEAVKKAFGINVEKGSEGASLTPAASASASASRPRRDLNALIEKAMKGAHGKLLADAVAANFVITNVENTERWFGLSVTGDYPVTRLSPRFDVSPLKNGAYSVSLYLNDRATGLKEKLVAAEGAPVTNEAIIASMKGDMFKTAIAGWKPEAPKAA